MSSRQSIVLWIGLVIIALNVATKAGEFKSVIFSGSGGSGGGSGGGTVPGGGQIGVGPGHITIPIGGFPITIPLAKRGGISYA